MEHFIAWCGFFGAWLLFAGPIYQASIELQEEEFNRESFAEVFDRVPEQDHPSPLWWLLPPVAYYLQQRSKSRFRELLFAEMTVEEKEQIISFFAKARGWMIVAAGAFFIALKETWELHELYEWHLWVFWALVLLMALLGVGHTAGQQSRGQKKSREERQAQRERRERGERGPRRERPERPSRAGSGPPAP